MVSSTLIWPLIALGLVNAGVSVGSIFNQRSMLREQEDFNSAEAEKARDWSSEGQRFDRMTQLGFNPDLAATSIMGGSQSVPYAASSPNAPQTPSILDAFQSMLSQLPNMNVSEKKSAAEIRHLDLLSDKLGIENGFLPLSLKQQQDYWNVYIDKLKTEHWIDFENWKKLSAQADWARPMAAAEYFDTLNRGQSLLAQADAYWAEATKDYAEVDLIFPNLAEYYGSSAAESRSRIGVNVALEGLYLQQKETESWRTKSELYDSALKYYDSQFRTMTLGMPFSNDLMQDIFMLRATPEGRKISDRLFQAVLNGNRELYDFKIQQDMKHWSGNLVNSIVNGGFTDMVSSGMGTVPFLLYGAGKGSRPYPKAVSMDNKPSPSNVSVEVGKSYVKQSNKSRPNVRFKDEHGNVFRIDSYGNRWVNGEIVD